MGETKKRNWIKTQTRESRDEGKEINGGSKDVSPSRTFDLQTKYHSPYIKITRIQKSLCCVFPAVRLQLLQATLQRQTAPLCTPNLFLLLPFPADMYLVNT